MRKVVFIPLIFLLFVQKVTAQSPSVPKAVASPAVENEKQTTEQALQRLMPNSIQGKQDCSAIDKLRDFFGGFACDSKNLQNSMTPNTQNVDSGENNGSVQGASISAVLGARNDGEVKGFSIPIISGLLNFINQALGGKETGGAFYNFRSDTLGVLTEQQGETATKQIFRRTENTLLPNSMAQGDITPSPLPTDVIPTGGIPTIGPEPTPGNGQPTPTNPPVVPGLCPYGTGYCTVDNLQKYFSKIGSAQRASIICQRESGSNPFVTNKGCLTGRSVDYSIGLFQINLLAFCASAFRYTWNPPSCTILDQAKADSCEQELLDPNNNIQKMVNLSKSGTDWGPWMGAARCNIPNGDYPLDQITTTPAPQPSVEGCPVSSERIYLAETIYQHLDQQLSCIKPSAIVIHWSGAWAPAQATFDVLNQRKLSCQFAVDHNVSLQMLDLYPEVVQKGYCVGNGWNDKAINFEISGAWFDDIINSADPTLKTRYDNLIIQTDKTIKLVCKLLTQYNISKSEIYGHYQLYSGKSDPGVEYLKYFKRRVENECN